MSIHKNYIEGYGRNWNKLCDEKILPYQGEIFKLFSDKFHIDAEKDGERGRKLLKSRGNKCSELCNEIHLIFGGNDIVHKDLKDFVDNIVNLDYNSLSEVFETLKVEYMKSGEEQVASQIEVVCIYLEKMWRISQPHTTIKKHKFLLFFDL